MCPPRWVVACWAVHFHAAVCNPCRLAQRRREIALLIFPSGVWGPQDILHCLWGSWCEVSCDVFAAIEATMQRITKSCDPQPMTHARMADAISRGIAISRGNRRPFLLNPLFERAVRLHITSDACAFLSGARVKLRTTIPSAISTWSARGPATNTHAGSHMLNAERLHTTLRCLPFS